MLQFDPSRVSLDEAWSMCAVGTVEELVGTEGGTGTEEGREAGREGEGDVCFIDGSGSGLWVPEAVREGSSRDSIWRLDVGASGPLSSTSIVSVPVCVWSLLKIMIRITKP